MRCGCLILLAAGCGFNRVAESPDSQVPDGGIPDMRNFDAAALRAGQFVDMTLDGSRSSLTPNGYTYGGLLVHGVAGTKLWNHGDTAWSKLGTLTSSATAGGGLWRGESFTTGDRLDYLGIMNDTTMTLWFEGEVFLDAGSAEMFGLAADDVAFIDLAKPGTAAYTRILENTAASAPVDTPVSGWYPIRIGYANGDGSYSLGLTHSEAGATPAPWPRDRLRARGSEIGGTLRTVFGHRLLGGGLLGAPPITRIETGTLLMQTSFPSVPQGAPANDELWSARYAGQVYIDQPGSYTLRVDSDDGNRARLDAQRDEVSWGQNGRPGSTSVPATLDAGWADLFVDYDQATGNRSLRVRLQKPDGSTLEISPDHLRPVESVDDRLVSSSDDNPRGIPDNGGVTNPAVATFSVAGFPGETVGSIDVTFLVNGPRSDQLTADLETPAGTRVQIRGKAQIDNLQGAQVTIKATAADATATLLGGPAKGAWKLDVYDDAAGGSGSGAITSAKLTLHTRNGPDKLARAARWTSAVIDTTTSVSAIDGITWKDRIPAGAGVQVRLATCQQADCSDAVWSDPVTRATAFAVTPARYLQLRVDLTSDGSREPELLELGIKFRRAS
jgi:subtilisin-like proprotein convertase family protein